MTLPAALVPLVAALAPEVIPIVTELVKAILSSGNQLEAAKKARRAAVEAGIVRGFDETMKRTMR